MYLIQLQHYELVRCWGNYHDEEVRLKMGGHLYCVMSIDMPRFKSTLKTLNTISTSGGNLSIVTSTHCTFRDKDETIRMVCLDRSWFFKANYQPRFSSSNTGGRILHI